VNSLRLMGIDNSSLYQQIAQAYDVTVRHLTNLEIVYIYEGTDHIHPLILGQDLTGILEEIVLEPHRKAPFGLLEAGAAARLALERDA
jgi:hypothetical protein